MAHYLRFEAVPDGAPEIGGPKAERLVSGAPVHRTWVTYETPDGKMFCGVWESTPGAWRVVFDEWESCTILEGVVIVTPDVGTPVALGAGDSLVTEPGFTGTWEVLETVRKTFVIRV
jgi:uncharacterized cupin superfamily protein